MDTDDNSLTGKIRGWFERSPKAQRAYERLSADLDTVVERVDSATRALRERIAPIIDPQRGAEPEPAPTPPIAQDEPAAPLAEGTTSETEPGPPDDTDGRQSTRRD